MGQTLEDMRRELTVLRAELGWHDDPERPPAPRRSDGPHQTSADFESAETIAARVRGRKRRDQIALRITKLKAAIEALNPVPPTLREKVADQILHDFVVENRREPTLHEWIVESQGYITQFAKMAERGLL